MVFEEVEIGRSAWSDLIIALMCSGYEP
jgi:hypothetical protein